MAPGTAVTIGGRGKVYEIDRIEGASAWMTQREDPDVTGHCLLRLLQPLEPSPPTSWSEHCPDVPPDWL